MSTLPNLAGVATDNLVEQIGGSGFAAKYINWSRTMNLLRTHAPDWEPEIVASVTGELLHRAPVGAFLLIRFRHPSGIATAPVPQAVMDNTNKAVPYDKITARDVTDTHVRGVCKAAAFTFGLAYELWAKLPLESGFAETDGSVSAEEARKIKCREVAEAYADSVAAIKNGLDSGDYYTAAEAWYELDEATKRALWVAPTKGGVFTTKQRDQMRTDEFTKYRPQQEQAA